MDCIFCKINNNEIPSKTIYEDEIIMVILDIAPHTNGECLIITKNHYENILDIKPEILNHIFIKIKELYPILKNKLNFDGLTISNNNELGQEIKHFHIHLIPRYHEKQALLSLDQIYDLIKETK